MNFLRYIHRRVATMDSLKNVSYFLERLNGYQKNTVMVQPEQWQDIYRPNEYKITFKLPQNAIIDLQTLTLSVNLGLTTSVAGANNGVCPPKFAACQIRRLDVMVGGVQVGLSNLADYGGLYSLHRSNIIDTTKMRDMVAMEATGSDSYLLNGGGGTQFFQSTAPNVGTRFYRQHIRDWMGLLGGDYMRYLDTNLLPDVSIMITLAPNSILINQTNTTPLPTFAWYTPKLYMEIVKFGDSTYEQMVTARMSTGEPIVVPFTNWAMFEGTSEIGLQGTGQLQFTIATQSLNRLWGTFRVGDYDSQQDINVCRMITIGAPNNVAFGRGGSTPINTQSYFYRFTSLAGGTGKYPYSVVPTNTADIFSDATTQDAVAGPARYQFEVDSKLYPQFLADIGDAMALTKNALDRTGFKPVGASNLYDNSNVWAYQAFALVTSFQHNDDGDYKKDRLISGLNTAGSNVPIVWRGTNISLPAKATTALAAWATTQCRPTVFAEMTSTLLVFPGRVISVVN